MQENDPGEVRDRVDDVKSHMIISHMTGYLIITATSQYRVYTVGAKQIVP